MTDFLMSPLSFLMLILIVHCKVLWWDSSEVATVSGVFRAPKVLGVIRVYVEERAGTGQAGVDGRLSETHSTLHSQPRVERRTTHLQPGRMVISVIRVIMHRIYINQADRSSSGYLG